MYAIKAEIIDATTEEFAFSAQKTMYGGRYISSGDTIYRVGRATIYFF